MVEKASEADKQIGLRVRALRHSLNIDADYLGGKVGLTPNQLRKLETGQHKISAVRLQAIAQALGAPVAYLYGEPIAPAALDGATSEMADIFVSLPQKVQSSLRLFLVDCRAALIDPRTNQ
jgi:transcriptional regulator with XRE-family HTH domain